MHIPIVGGGFAGVRAALQMDKLKLGKITLISNEPYFLHHATLYQIATGGNKDELVIPLTEIFSGHSNVKVVTDTIKSVDPDRKMVVGAKKSYDYDQLVIAVGSVTNFFNIDGIAKHAYGIKSLQEVEKFTAHIREEIVTTKHLDKNYFVIGAGQTGVELAASLSEELTDLTNANKGVHGKVHLMVVEADKRVTPRLSATASKIIAKRLAAINIKVLTNHKVTSLDNEDIVIDGRARPTETAIWTSGVANNPFFAANQPYFTLSKNGRVEVDEHLMAYPNIYVLGDNNNVKFSGTARPAYAQAEFLARHLYRIKTHASFKKFRPHNPPCAVPVGRNWAYVEYGEIYVAGRTGYALRRLLELNDYTKILPFALAVKTWQKHDVKAEN